MAIQGYISLTLEVFPEGKKYVSRCRELGVTSFGRDVAAAFANVKDAVTTYLNAIEELGDRERIFAEKGIVIRKTKPRTVTMESLTLPPNSYASGFILPIAA